MIRSRIFFPQRGSVNEVLAVFDKVFDIDGVCVDVVVCELDCVLVDERVLELLDEREIDCE